MSMPNRSAEVAALCAQHPEAFPPGDQNDPARLAFLKGTIIPTLNRLDGGQWGFMTKTDQGGKVPCDILMWRPTNDVVDCMTGTGGAWIVHAPPPPAWVWTAVDDGGETGGNGTPNDNRTEIGTATGAEILARLNAIESKLDQLLAR